MKKLLLSFIILHSSFIFSAAQQIKLDSLYNNWQNESLSDSVRVFSYAEFLYYGFAYSQQDSLILKADTLIKYSEMHNITWGKGNAYNLIGLAYQGQGQFTLAMEYYNRALRIRKEINDKRGIAGTLNNIGNIYSNLGGFPRALEYFKAALKINKELNNVRFIEINLLGIGTIYQLQGNFESALAYYNESLNLTETTGDEDIAAATLNNMAEIYANTKDYAKALAHYQRSLQVFKKHQIENGIVQSAMGLGAVYAGLNNYTKAYESIESALLLSKKLNDQLATATCYVRLGELNQKQNKHSSSLENCNQGLIISEELSALPIQKQACECLYNSYKTLGEGSKALFFLEKIQVIDDSLNAEETSKKLQQMEFAKQVYQDSIATAEKDRLVLEAHQEEMRQEEQTRNVAFGIGGFLLLLAGGLYTRVRYIRKSKATLQVEKDRSENLLLNILPEEIAQELKIYGKAEARDFDLVSILFTDFKGFTEQSAKLSAAELVHEINHCFEAFDGIIEKYNVEKIKTIGDAYMAAGGLPVPTDDSVKNTVLAALEMQDFIVKRKTEMDAANKPAFEMRVGIHTGPVVAGIVGVKKFQYDIWGDTVNTAARMESSGQVGKVNISQATYELLKDDVDFAFESRGKIEAKGKGEMEMYFVSVKSN